MIGTRSLRYGAAAASGDVASPPSVVKEDVETADLGPITDAHPDRLGELPFEQRVELALRRGIERRACLVEEEPIGALQQRARERETLRHGGPHPWELWLGGGG